MKVLYVKYSDYRNEEYRIRTQIIEENQKRYIVKEALNEKSIAHINSIMENKKRLEDINFKFKLANCWITEKKLMCDYIVGETLDKTLIDIFLKYGTDQFLKKLEEIKKLFDSSWNPEIVNTDLNFDNIFLDETGNYVIIDYEWVYKGELPISYPLYKALLIFWDKYGAIIQNKISLHEIFKYVGINKNEIEEFSKINLKFNEKIIAKSNFNLKSSKLVDLGTVEKFAQIYFDYGEGYSEETSKLILLTSNTKNIIKIKKTEKQLEKLRIDPINSKSNIKINYLINENNEEISYTVNSSFEFNNQFFCFFHNDPQIEITSRLDFEELTIEFEFLDFDQVIENVSTIQKVEEVKKSEKIKFLEAKIMALQKEIKEKPKREQKIISRFKKWIKVR